MNDSSDVQALAKISTVVNEFRCNVLLSTKSLKVERYLAKKLQGQNKQLKQICNFSSNDDLKLKTEIRLAAENNKSSQEAFEIIKRGNANLRVERLLSKEETTERLNSNIKKYEKLWIARKQRNENIPFVKNDRKPHDKITNLYKEKQKLLDDINKKKYELFCSDKIYIVKLARYMIHEKPVTLKKIKNKRDEVNKLIKNIQDVSHSNESATVLKVQSTVDTLGSYAAKTVQVSWPNLSMFVDNKTILVPKLQLQSVETDLDFFGNKLDEINKIENISTNRVDSESLNNQPKKINMELMIEEAYVSSYFPKNNEKSVDLKSNLSEKKLIHILKDEKLDKTETFEILAKVNSGALQTIDRIGQKVQEKIVCPKQNENPGEDKEKNEEIIYTNMPVASNVLMPPSQFLDFSQNEFINSQGQIHAEEKITKNSQEKRKKVIFNEIMSVKSTDINDLEKPMDEDDNNDFNVSATSDENNQKIKENVFKTHNLDASPQFTYTKNCITSMRSENVVKSKFFDENNKNLSMDVEEKPAEVNKVESSQKIDDDDISPGTINENKDGAQNDTLMSGFLLTHGQKGIVDSLDVSVSTQGFDESDLLPHIDFNLLLSPKADDEKPTTSGNAQVISQEPPNFLSGAKKRGWSFFENQQPEDKCSTTQTPKSNFTFAFGGDAKKPRGGFFSLFH